MAGSFVAVEAQTPTPGQPAPAPPTALATPARLDAPVTGSAVVRGQVVSAEIGPQSSAPYVRAMSAEGRSGGVTSTDVQRHLQDLKVSQAPQYQAPGPRGQAPDSGLGASA